MEDKNAVDFQKSQVMPGRPQRDTVIALALALLPIIAVAAVLLFRNQSGGEAAPVVPAESSILSDGPSLAKEPASILEESAAAFDYEAAARLTALRWQAMADYYRDNGLLTRDLSGAEAVDPADRKFLDGSYRLQVPSVVSSAVDPADIKFLNGSYRLGLPPAEYRLADETEATFTQKYWDMAAGNDGVVIEPVEDDDAAYFTEKYWRMAAEKATAEPVTPEWILRHDQHRPR